MNSRSAASQSPRVPPARPPRSVVAELLSVAGLDPAKPVGTEDLQREYDELTDLFLSEESLLTERDDAPFPPSALDLADSPDLTHPNTATKPTATQPAPARPSAYQPFSNTVTKPLPSPSQPASGAPGPPGQPTVVPASRYNQPRAGVTNSNRAPAPARPAQANYVTTFSPPAQPRSAAPRHTAPASLNPNLSTREKPVVHPVAQASRATSQSGPAAPLHLAARIECLVVGHLSPGGTPLVCAYADALAIEQPITILHLRAGQLTLELRSLKPAALASLPLNTASDLTSLLSDALGRARQASSTLLIHLDETAEVDLLSPAHAAADDNTDQGRNRYNQTNFRTQLEPDDPAPLPPLPARILCTCDDLAVVSTYRAIRHFWGLSGPSPRPEYNQIPPPHSESEPTSLVVTILAEPGQGTLAVAAASRLHRTCHAFLSRAISTEIVDSFPDFADSSSSSFSPPTANQSVVLLRRPITLPLQALLQTAWEIFSAPPPSPAPGLPTLRALKSTPRQHEKTAPLFTPATTRAAAPPADLAPLIPGLQNLKIASPYTPAVEFAVDEQAQLHLITGIFLSEGTPRLASECVGELLTAAAWAADHAQLLTLAIPGMKAQTIRDQSPTLHIVSEDPRSVISVLGAGVCVHLAAYLQGRWLCRAMN